MTPFPHKVLGVIPARGGSKGIPKKNLHELGGKPLIAYTIESALKAKTLTHVVFSTDCEEIAAVAKQFGAWVPFLRPAEFATDKALSIDVVKHALKFVEGEKKIIFDAVVLLQPTTPLKLAQDIDGAVQKLFSNPAIDSVVSMVDVGANHPARMYSIENDRLVSVMAEGIAMRPRQELPPIYIRNGAVYVCKREVLFQHNALMGAHTSPYIMCAARSVNIDSITDFILAEYFIKNET